MIYASLAGLNKLGLEGAIQALCQYDIRNIELSGAYPYYTGIVDDLLKFKKKYHLNYLCHNYFPHPKNSFVLNLASLNNHTYEKSVSFLKSKLKMAKKLGSKRFGFHAGFFIDIQAYEAGKPLTYKELFNKKKSIERFCEGFNELKAQAHGLDLYIENNVLSLKNFETFKKINPLMLTTFEEYQILREKIDFKLLLDVGHLKVSASSLGLDFTSELTQMIAVSDYLHLSDNDSFSDQNRSFSKESDLYQKLHGFYLKNKTMTLEINDPVESMQNTYRLLNDAEEL